MDDLVNQSALLTISNEKGMLLPQNICGLFSITQLKDMGEQEA